MLDVLVFKLHLTFQKICDKHLSQPLTRNAKNVCVSTVVTLHEAKADSQCTYNVTWDAFAKPLLPWKAINITYLCACGWVGVGERARVCLRACSLTYETCNAPPYCHLRPLWLHNIFRHYLINDMTLGIKLFNLKRCFWFPLKLLLGTFLILRRIQREIVINVETSSCKVPFILVGF